MRDCVVCDFGRANRGIDTIIKSYLLGRNIEIVITSNIGKSKNMIPTSLILFIVNLPFLSVFVIRSNGLDVKAVSLRLL